jgi:Domain of unknown function (DUF4389)
MADDNVTMQRSSHVSVDATAPQASPKRNYRLDTVRLVNPKLTGGEDMSMLTLDATYPETRNRLTCFFRTIVAIPHLIVAGVWGYWADILGVVQWFIIVFTGKRNKGIYDMQRSWLDYHTRVMTYVVLLHDVFPPFGSDAGTVPVRANLEYEEAGNRLTTALRFIWIIPAAIILIFVVIGAYFVLAISWLVILFTGKQPQGMWNYMHKAVQMALRLQAYSLNLTDTYPSYA